MTATRSRPTCGRSSTCPATSNPATPPWPRPPPRRHVRRQVAAKYPGAVACVVDDLLAFLRFPREHWRRIRHTNLVERTFGESRRRVKVIGRLPGERSCLSLVWAVLERVSRGWQGRGHDPRHRQVAPTAARRPVPPPRHVTRAADRPPKPSRRRVTSPLRNPRSIPPFTPALGRHPLPSAGCCRSALGEVSFLGMEVMHLWSPSLMVAMRHACRARR